jgi:hypothetical protein
MLSFLVKRYSLNDIIVSYRCSRTILVYRVTIKETDTFNVALKRNYY